MSYANRSQGTGEAEAEEHRQELDRGILSYRKSIATISVRLRALRNQADREVASADDTTSSGYSPESDVETLQTLTQRANCLEAEQAELRRQQEQLVVTALETGLLGAPWLAVISGLSLERVNVLALQAHQKGTTFKQSLDAQGK
jgi:hypothetical protein